MKKPFMKELTKHLVIVNGEILTQMWRHGTFQFYYQIIAPLSFIFKKSTKGKIRDPTD